MGGVDKPVCFVNTHTYSPVSSRRGVDHVYTGGGAEDLTVADGMWDVDVPIDTALDELHVVFSQSARLVSKYILHLEENEGKYACKLLYENFNFLPLLLFCLIFYTVIKSYRFRFSANCVSLNNTFLYSCYSYI